MTGNKDRDFIVMRQYALQQFLNFITSHPILRHSVGLKNFIHPSLYSGGQQGILDNRVHCFVNFLLINYYYLIKNFSEAALQNISMSIRSQPKYEIVKILPEIGWRASKFYYLV